jgi:hypothetical protein
MLLLAYAQIMRKGWRMSFNPYAERRPFPCPHCAMEYKRNGWLVRHVLAHHQDTDTYDLLLAEFSDADAEDLADDELEDV